MLHDAGQRQGKRLGNARHRQPVLAGEAGEYRPPRRIGECGESQVELRLAIVNHTVKYGETSARCQWCLCWVPDAPPGAPPVVAPIGATRNSTSMLPAFSKASVPLTVRPSFKPSLNPMNMM